MTAVPNGARPVSGDPSAAKSVLDAPGLARVVDRMAHELLEKTGGGADVVLLGIPTRGTTLAARLASRIEAFEGRSVPTGSLDITLYRDDLRLKSPRALEETEVPADGIDGKLVVLVDDVLFSGRTVRAALDALADLGRPRRRERVQGLSGQPSPAAPPSPPHGTGSVEGSLRPERYPRSACCPDLRSCHGASLLGR